MTTARTSPALLTLALLTAACGDDGGDGDGGDSTGEATTGADAAVTYWRDVKAVLDRGCVGCHAPGNIAPFALTTYAEAAPFAAALAASVSDGTMPPWPPDAACNQYRHDRSLTADERALLVEWSELGAPEGDPADAPAPAAEDPADVVDYDLELALPVAYTPTIAPDEYRCFTVDWPAAEERFVTAFKAAPGERAIVHHVIAFLIPPDKVAEFEALDAADPDPGYLCYGGPGGTRPGWLGAWVPGSNAGALPPGTGIRVAPGSKVVVQMHYHATPGAGPDRTTLAIRTADAVEREAFVVPFTDPAWLAGGMEIPAGEPEVVHEFAVDLSKAAPLLMPDGGFASGDPLRVHALALHMHTFGTSADVTVLRAGGDEVCGLSIPRWDFDWQGNYQLAAPIDVALGDRLRLRCRWDNSADAQPLVDGVRQPAKDLRWGEGTGDEMCLGVAYLTRP
jgi:hypothetical protein